MEKTLRSFSKALAIVSLFIVFGIVFWIGFKIILIAFAGILLAIFLTAVSRWFRGWSHLPYPICLLLVMIFILGFIGVIFYLFSPLISRQINELSEQLPKAYNKIQDYFKYYFNWSLFSSKNLPSGETLITNLAAFFASTFNLFVYFFVFLFVGIYLAFSPQGYTRLFLILFKKERRPELLALLKKIGASLEWWLFGQILSMLIVGTVTAIGLWLLDIPLAFLLGLLTGLLTFIPNIGPTLSAVPPALLALIQDPIKALYVIVMYIGIQSTESYLVTPSIQKKMVSLPPAIIIVAQVLMGLLGGIIGLALATPLVVVLGILIEEYFVKNFKN